MESHENIKRLLTKQTERVWNWLLGVQYQEQKLKNGQQGCNKEIKCDLH